ncbi:polysaccharide biosynthesis tyrosine autokinase [Novosphingobium sp. Fuku2-ISO-50]|uniref:GumC family protein n=1 Tax=Novosphingobium sp. Fuku2-ISO-50 TaxID=1739114 RepID=UPI00076D63FB|nr:polysaccharide biosynthesis tyrosine autokinase [Novosphingobium sp. Fuku2-ISO-50]KUR76222.1 lipopolysaccharide biosynthesis protein [Novosphingobium sp. Fuku2-ISO-50]
MSTAVNTLDSSAVGALRGPGDVLPAWLAEPRAVPVAGNDRIDLKFLIGIFRRRSGLFVSVLGGSLAIGAIVTALQPRIYVAHADVTLSNKTAMIAPASTNDRVTEQQAPTDAFVDTQVAQVTSSDNMNAVIDRLGLDKDPRIVAEAGRGAARLATIDYLRKHLNVQRIGSTYDIGITYDSRSADQAAKVANAFAEQFTRGALDAKRDGARQTTGMIAARLDQLRSQALADSAAEQNYRIAHNLLSTNQGTLTEQEISAYNQELARARAEQAEDAARLDAARHQQAGAANGGNVGETLASPAIAALRAQQATAAGELASLQARYGSLHPDVIKARATLRALDEQVAGETRRVIAGLEAKAQASDQRLASLSGSLTQSRGALAISNSAKTGLQDLEKRAETSNALYESYLNRYKELTAREGTEQADAEMLHPASVPLVPDSPHVLINLILSFAVGLGLGVAAAFLAELNYSGITTGDDIEQRLGVRYLGSIPSLGSVMVRGRKASPTEALIESPRSAFAESFRSLRASIAMNTTNAKVIAITSSLPDEGKTTTSICLARSMAASGDRVLLIDCDLRRQGVSEFVPDREGRPGLIEVLRGEVELDAAISVDPATGLAILPVSRDTTDAPELLTGDEMDRLLETARAKYHAVIIDTAPVLPIADARLVLGKADASVFVVRWRKTPDSALRAALRLLPGNRVQLAGVALTRVDMRKQARFGYGEDAFYHSYRRYYS